MQKAGDFLASVAGRMKMVKGSCEEHGEADVLVRLDRPDWYCPVCLDRKTKEEEENYLKNQRVGWMLEGAKIPSRFFGQRFMVRSEEHAAVKHQVAAFRDFVVQQGGWASLVLTGITGTGKSLLACELLESMIRKRAVSGRYVTAGGMISEIQATYSSDTRSQEEEIAKFSAYDLLIVDEADAIPQKDGAPSANALLLMNEIYNRRYSNGRATVTISNQLFETLNHFLGDRIFSRINQNMYQCAHTWADERRAA
ncbi:ATP-binding protein [Pseudoduganella sp. RAF19]